MTTMTSAQTHRVAGPARQRDFRRLWLGYSISAVGSEITVLAVPLTAAVLLGASAFQMGLLTAAATLPNLAIGLVAGVWVDRLPRRRPVLVATDLASAAALLSIPIAWWLGALTVTQLVVVELGVGCARVIFRPAYQSHLPQVVDRDHLTTASGHLRASDSGAMLAGPGLGGLLVQAVSAPVAILLDAASFLVSAALHPIAPVARAQHARRTTPNRSMRADLGEGLVGGAAQPLAAGHRRLGRQPQPLRDAGDGALRRLRDAHARPVGRDDRCDHDDRRRRRPCRRPRGSSDRRQDRRGSRHRRRDRRLLLRPVRAAAGQPDLAGSRSASSAPASSSAVSPSWSST